MRWLIYSSSPVGEKTQKKKFLLWYPKKVRASVWSHHAEALAALTDGQLQQFVQFLVGVVGREAQLVKTREVPRKNKNKIITSYYNKRQLIFSCITQW